MSSLNILERWFWQTKQPFRKPARNTADALGTAAEASPTLHTISFFLNYFQAILVCLVVVVKGQLQLKTSPSACDAIKK